VPRRTVHVPRRAVLAFGVASVIAFSPAPAAAVAALPTAALPTSEYQARHVCSAPIPGHASCLALELVRGGGKGRQDFAAGQNPQPVLPNELRNAYHLPEQAQGSAVQTIALVDAYNDLNAEADLEVYDHAPAIGLSECNGKDDCFRKVDQDGTSAEAGGGGSGFPFPRSAKELQEREATCKSGKERVAREAACAEVQEALGWTVETSTDIDVAHSVCQSCRILLVEADSTSYEDLEAAEETAVRLGATEVSNSWGGPEPPLDSPAFDHPKTVITAAAGDFGYLNWTEAEAGEPSYFAGADYPASSPHVVAVGGTELTLTGTGERESETVWNEDPDPEGKNEGAGGGGCSMQFSAPEWQRQVPDWSSVGCGTGEASKRAVADVAADADPYSGVLVYDSSESKEHLLVIGGTSVASPIIASAFALAGGAHEVSYPAQTLYSHLGSASLYDVTEGGNGACDDVYTGSCSGSMEPLSPLDCGAGVLICNAAHGYDGPTGVGAPNGIAAFEPLNAEEQQQATEKKHAEEELRAAEEKREAAERKAAEEKAAEEQQKAAEKINEENLGAGTQSKGSGKEGTVGSDTGTGSGNGASTGTTVAGSASHSAGSAGGARENSSAGTSGQAAVRLSQLALTARASAVIAGGLPTLSQVAVAFSLSAPARVRVVLSREVRLHGRLRWVLVKHASLTLAAARGRDRLHLDGRETLPTGRYRLTLTPVHGGARSLMFRLR
jgi:hypothetical protein